MAEQSSGATAANKFIIALLVTALAWSALTTALLPLAILSGFLAVMGLIGLITS